MHFNGETWLRILILFYSLIVSASCLRGSELVLHAAKAKLAAGAAKATESEGEISGAEGSSSNTTTEKSLLTGIPQIDYIHDPNLPRELNGYNLSNYPFYNAIPSDIDFKCDGLHDGFYASVPHYCQVYHHCLYGQRYDFLCANYTAFDQKTFICHFVSEVDCNNSPKYYQRNEALYKAATSAPIIIKTTTTTTTTEAPVKKEDDVRRPGPFRPRRPPYRRRPSYDYAGNEDYYAYDYYYYGPPVRKRPNRNKGFRGDPYYGGERSGGHKSIHRDRDPPRRKPLKPIYEDDYEDYEYYDDSVDGSRDDDDRRRPLDNNYRKPSERDRPLQNKKRDKDLYNRESLRNDKKKRTEEDYANSRKNDDDMRLRNKYKSFTQRSKYDRDEDDFDDIEDSRRYQDDKREKQNKNKSLESKRENDKPYRSKIGPKSTTPLPDDDYYEDVVVTPKWKSRFQARRPFKEESSKKTDSSNISEEDDSAVRNNKNSDRPKDSNKEKPQEATEASVAVVSINPQIYARQPSKLYSQVKVETRPPPVQRNKDLYKADVPATTMSSYKRPSNSRLGAKDRAPAETAKPKPHPKYTTPTPLEEDEYEDEDSLLEDTAPAKSYYEEDVSETDLTDQFPSRTSPTVQQPTKNARDQSQTEPQIKNVQRNKPTYSSYNQRYKQTTERQTPSYSKQITTERQSVKPDDDEEDFVPFQPLEQSQTLPLHRQAVTERQPFHSSKQTLLEKQTQSTFPRQPYPERQPIAERLPTPDRVSLTDRQPLSERQPQSQRQHQSDRESQSERHPPVERQPFTDRQTFNERQPFTDRQTFSERQPYADRQPFVERQPITDRQSYTERQPVADKQPQAERQPLVERQPYVERQPLSYSKQVVTERVVPFQKQPVTERQVFSYVKQPVTERQLIPFKQIVTERQIVPYLRQTEIERKPLPFPKQPPRTFEITAPGPSGLGGGRIEVSDSIQRGKYVLQNDRPTGFSLRLPQTDYSNPLQSSTQIQRRPEEANPEKIVTRPSFKPVRSYRAKPTAETQYHDSVRLDTFPQRYLTGTEEYEPVVVSNARIPAIPQISHVSNTKEWYW